MSKYNHITEAQARKRRKGSKTRTVLTGKVLEYIETKLKEYWSPDQISNAGKLELSPVEVSVESIYEYIYLPENKTKKLWKYLRRSRPKRKKKSQRIKEVALVISRVIQLWVQGLRMMVQ